MNIEERFGDEVAGKYDAAIRSTAFGYESLHEMIPPLLKASVPNEARILVVGAGTGKEISTLGNSSPGWTLTGVDPSRHMVSVARERLSTDGLTSRSDILVGYTDDLPADARFDAATAILVMHFLPDDGTKLRFLKSISSRLAPGAALVLADLHGDPSSIRFSTLMNAWRTRQRSLGMEEENIEEMFRDLGSSVHFIPEERIETLLRETGFTDVTRFHTAMLFGGWLARKPT